ncbi:MAG: hypothetical protein M1831_002188 [Alyxoria varia]|nr:MAG: hypothetical protein M1831_002188 [Alyxoria varia]
MDTTDGVLEAGMDINPDLTSNNEPGRTSAVRRGEDSVLIAAGGIEPSRGDSETSPLLAEQHDPEEHGGPDEEDGDRGWTGLQDFDHLPWWKKPSIFWLVPSFLLFTLAFGGIIVPKVNLITDLICREYYSSRALNALDSQDDNSDMCSSPVIESRVGSFMLAGNLIAGILSAVTSPKIGALSDRYGRKPLLCFTVVGSLVSELFTLLPASFPDTLSVYWILLGSITDGLCGSFIAGFAIVNSYTSDCTPPSKRNVAFGFFHGSLFAGIALGPLISGKIVKATGSVLSVFYVCFICHAVFLALLGLAVPESLSKKRMYIAREKHAHENPAVPWQPTTLSSAWASVITFIKRFPAPLKILVPTGPGTSPALRKNLVLLSTIDFLVFGIAMGALNVTIIYVRGQFHWDVDQQSTYISIVNIVRVLGLLTVLPGVTWLFRGRYLKGKAPPAKGCDLLDLNIIRISVFLDFLGFVGYTLARTGPLFTLSGALAATGGMASPTLQSALTKHIPAHKTGQLLGASGFLHAVARVIAPAVFNGIFSLTVGKFSQAVFLCLAGSFFVAFTLTWALRTGIFFDEQAQSDDDSNATHEE